MATVLVSKQFLSSVEEHINKMRDDELKLKRLSDCGSLELGALVKPRFLEAIAWGEHTHLRNMMPQEWLSNREYRISLELKTESNTKIQLPVEFPRGNALMPPQYSAYRNHTVTPEMLNDRDKYGSCPDYNLVVDTFKKLVERTAVFRKWGDTAAAVKKFFEACPSVNKAVALQPSMMLYVPKEYILKLETQVERKKREVPEIDADNLAAQVVALRLCQSVGA